MAVLLTASIGIWLGRHLSGGDSADVWSADHETGDASQWPQITTNWDNAGCTEHRVVADGHAQSGIYSMKMTLSRAGGCRQARLPEIQTGTTYIYEASFFLPKPVLTISNHWNIFQFKSKKSSTVSGSDPIWTIDFQGNPLRPVLSWKGGTYGLTGPFATDRNIGQADYPNTLSTTPIGQWTTLEVYFDQSSSFDGALKVWQDGVLLYDMQGVKTEYPSNIAQWSVNNYSNGLTVFPYTLYIDDAEIREP
jgi:hypothetical protein